MSYTFRSWELLRVLANELPECGAHRVLLSPVTCFPEGSLFDFHTSPQSDPGLEGTWVCRTASTREWWEPFCGLRSPESDLSRPPAKPHPRLPPLESLTWEARKEVRAKGCWKERPWVCGSQEKAEWFWILAPTQQSHVCKSVLMALACILLEKYIWSCSHPQRECQWCCEPVWGTLINQAVISTS